MTLLDAAQDAVSRATAAGTHLDREAVAEWFELKARATGEERTLIEGFGEALVAAAGRDVDWIEEQLARGAMGDRMQDEAFAFAPERGPRDIGGGMTLLDEVGPIPREVSFFFQAKIDPAPGVTPDGQPYEGIVRHMEMMAPASRGDAADGEEGQKHGGAGLDWSLIGKEVRAMIRLNPQDRSESVTEEDAEPQE